MNLFELIDCIGRIVALEEFYELFNGMFHSFLNALKLAFNAV